jgi:hypothetical protein
MLFEATLDAFIEHRALTTVVLREEPDLAGWRELMKRFVEFLEGTICWVTRTTSNDGARRTQGSSSMGSFSTTSP